MGQAYGFTVDNAYIVDVGGERVSRPPYTAHATPHHPARLLPPRCPVLRRRESIVRPVRCRRSFFLAATIYTNANGVLNDDQYEYESVAEP